MQHPFPAGLDFEAALHAARPRQGRRRAAPGQPRPARQGIPAPVACTPAGIGRCSRTTTCPSPARHVVMVGRGLTIGRPLANLLSLKRPARQRRRDRGAHRRARLGRVHPPGRHPRRRRGRTGPDHARPGAGPAASVIGAGVHVRGRKVLSDVVEEVAEVAGVDLAAHRRRRADDPGDAVPERRRRPPSAPPAERGRNRVTPAPAGRRAARRPSLVPITKITDLLAAGPTLSFEFFPPKTDEAERDARADARASSSRCGPSFVSVTYGAGGSTRERTHDIVIRINRETDASRAMAHLTCVGPHPRASSDDRSSDYRDGRHREHPRPRRRPARPSSTCRTGRARSYADRAGRRWSATSATSRSASPPTPSPTRARPTAAADRRRLAEKLAAGRLRDHPVLLRRRALLRPRRRPAPRSACTSR